MIRKNIIKMKKIKNIDGREEKGLNKEMYIRENQHKRKRKKVKQD